MKLISFSLTTPQIIARTKTVTRRMGWRNLKPGQRLKAVEKSQGLKKGEKVKVLCEIEVVSVTPESLWLMDCPMYGALECKKEGFPQMSPAQFVKFFCASHKGCTPETEVTRIEFKYV